MIPPIITKHINDHSPVHLLPLHLLVHHHDYQYLRSSNDSTMSLIINHIYHLHFMMFLFHFFLNFYSTVTILLEYSIRNFHLRIPLFVIHQSFKCSFNRFRFHGFIVYHGIYYYNSYLMSFKLHCII